MAFDPADVPVIFKNALAKSGDERDAYLSVACGDDADLRKLVEDLLDAARGQADAAPVTVAPETDGAKPPRRMRRWWLATAVVLLIGGGLVVAEASRFTNIRGFAKGMMHGKGCRR